MHQVAIQRLVFQKLPTYGELKMENFFPAFFCVFCLCVFAIVCLGTGLGLINPLLGVAAIVCIVFAIYSVAADIGE